MDPDEQLARLLQEEEDQAAAAAVRYVLFTIFAFFFSQPKMTSTRERVPFPIS